MTSNRAKGRMNEKKCEAKLKEAGWLTYLVPPSMRFQKNIDIFGLFDVIAIRTRPCLYTKMRIGEAPEKILSETEVLLVQVKTNYHGGYVEYRKFKENFPGIRVQLWNWQDHKGWLIKEI